MGKTKILRKIQRFNPCKFYSGKFIVFEGLDGSGQSTQSKLLAEFLKKKKYKILLTKEPTGTSEAGKKIRRILDKKTRVQPVFLQELFAKDRKEHLKREVIPALKKGKIVISDRYFFSSFAYGTASGLDLNWLIKMNNKFLLPDLTFILKVRPEICLKRIEKRGDRRTLFEEEEKLKKVWQVYKSLPKRFKNIRVVEGEKSKKEVFSQIEQVVLSKLNR